MSEQDRVAAEEGRVAAEQERDHAETGNGSDDPLEEGRVGAEAERVAAEQKREGATARRMGVLRKAVYGVFALFALATVAGFFALYRVEGLIHSTKAERQRVTQEICAGQNALRKVARDQIRSDDNLRSKIIYYQEHPDELAKVYARDLHALTLLTALPCKVLTSR